MTSYRTGKGVRVDDFFELIMQAQPKTMLKLLSRKKEK